MTKMRQGGEGVNARVALSSTRISLNLRRSRNTDKSLFYFQSITVIDFDEPAQTIFNRLRTQRPRVGTLDLRIAAIALSQEATLVTRNQRDFARIPSLNIEDWSLPEADGTGS